MNTVDLPNSSDLGVSKSTNLKVTHKLCTSQVLVGIAVGFFVALFVAMVLMLKTPRWACHQQTNNSTSTTGPTTTNGDSDAQEMRVNNARIGLCSVSIGTLAFLGYMLWASSR